MRGDARHSYACLLAEGAGLPRGPRVPRRGWGVGLGLSPPPPHTNSLSGRVRSALRPPPGTQLLSLLRGERGGSMSPLPGPSEGSARSPSSPVTHFPRTSSHQTNERQLLAVDHSARASMKNAASCEK